MQKLRQYKKLSGAERSFLREALSLSLRARYLTMFFSLKHYGYKLGDYRAESPQETEQAAYELADKVKDAVRRVAKYVPWRCKCLEQAIIAKTMLNKRKIESTLYLGVTRKDDKMIAHAWVRCGEKIITGGKGHGRYTAVSSFA